jgi:hypothetical protein
MSEVCLPAPYGLFLLILLLVEYIALNKYKVYEAAENAYCDLTSTGKIFGMDNRSQKVVNDKV